MKFVPALLILALATIYLLPATTFAQSRAQIAKERVASRTAEIKTRIAQTKEAFLERRIKHASESAERKETLKTQLKAIKDRKKATVAERLDGNLTKINENRTNSMLKHLDQMDSLVDRVEGRIATASAINTPDVVAAISVARDNIDSARAAVQDQAVQSYPVTISSEVTLRDDFQAVRDSLLEDLKMVHTQVIDARKSVNAIFETIAKAREGAANGQ